MSGCIATIIAAALGSVGAYFSWKSSSIRQRRDAEKDVMDADKSLEIKKAEIREAVYQNDDEKLNQITAKLMED